MGASATIHLVPGLPLPPRTAPVRIGDAPFLQVFDGFATSGELAHAIELAADRPALAARGITWRHGPTGFSFEAPLAGDGVLTALHARVTAVLGLADRLPHFFRFRHYAEGEAHPLHLDVYETRGFHLAATGMLHLVTPGEGGETRFPHARPGPAVVAARAGRLVAWRNLLPDGTPDPASLHEGLPVLRGRKMTLTAFVYVERAQLEAWAPASPSSAPPRAAP